MIQAAMQMVGQWAGVEKMFVAVGAFPVALKRKGEEAMEMLASMMRTGIRTGRFGLILNTGGTSELKSSPVPGLDTGSMVGAIDWKFLGNQNRVSIFFAGVPADAEGGGYPGPVTKNFWGMINGERTFGAWLPYHSPMRIVDIASQFVRDKVVQIPLGYGAKKEVQVPGRDFITPAVEAWGKEFEEEIPQFVAKYLQGGIR